MWEKAVSLGHGEYSLKTAVPKLQKYEKSLTL